MNISIGNKETPVREEKTSPKTKHPIPKTPIPPRIQSNSLWFFSFTENSNWNAILIELNIEYNVVRWFLIGKEPILWWKRTRRVDVSIQLALWTKGVSTSGAHHLLVVDTLMYVTKWQQVENVLPRPCWLFFFLDEAASTTCWSSNLHTVSQPGQGHHDSFGSNATSI